MKKGTFLNSRKKGGELYDRKRKISICSNLTFIHCSINHTIKIKKYPNN